MKKILFENGTTIDGASTFNQMQNNVEEVFNGEEPMGSIVVEDIECKNLFNKNDVSIGQLNIGDGIINTSIIIYRTSNFIDVLKFVGQSLFVNTADWFQVCYYDSNKVFISGEEYQTVEGHSTVVPSNAKYIRISTGVNSVDTTQLEKGDKATSYTPYKNFGFNPAIATGIASDESIELSGYSIIPIKTINTNSSKLTISNDGIRIGAGISKIKVSAQIGYFTENTIRQWFTINKNSIAVNQWIGYPGEQHYAIASFTPLVIDVAEGDVITLYLKNMEGTGSIFVNRYLDEPRPTFLTIEEVI